jgi:hypothetical protein
MADEPQSPDAGQAAPVDAAPPPESPLGPDFARAKAEAMAAVEAEARGETPDAEPAPDRGAPPPPADTPDPEQQGSTVAEEAGDDGAPLSRRERGELRELRKRVGELETRTPPQADPQQAADEQALVEIKRLAGLEGGAHGPDYATLDRMTKALDYDGLARLPRSDGQGVGYTLEEALGEIRKQETVQRALTGSARFFEQKAYATVGHALDTAAASLGLDPVETAKSAQEARGDPVAAYLKRLVDAAEKRGAEEWRGKYDAEQAAHKATRAGRVGRRATVETGGGPAGMGSVLQQVLSGSKNTDDFIERAKRGELAHLDLRD